MSEISIAASAQWREPREVSGWNNLHASIHPAYLARIVPVFFDPATRVRVAFGRQPVHFGFNDRIFYPFPFAHGFIVDHGLACRKHL
jgi:hypothetical protein